MGVLTDVPCNKVITNKSKFVINPAFDIILEVQKLYKEQTGVEVSLTFIRNQKIKMFKESA